MSDALKRAAAEAAVALVEPGMVVGLGTGSTAFFAIDALIRRVHDGLAIRAIPTSERSADQARAGGIVVIGFEQSPRIDLTIDGADEIAPGLALVKGLGGALLREKIVAASSARMVVIADKSKRVARLGEHAPVPVEVSPFGWQSTRERLAALGAEVVPRREGDGMFRTDGGNMILDLRFGPIEDPAALEARLRSVPGVLECGLFVGIASLALVAGPDGVERLSA